MAMGIVFANNQVIVAKVGVPSTITTDWVPLNGYDRASMVVNMHYGYGGATPATDQSLTIQTQVSNDGTTPVNVGSPVTVSDPSDSPKRDVRGVEAAFIRYEYTWLITTGSDGAVCFDQHVNLDHA